MKHMINMIPIILSLLLCRLYAQPGSLDTAFGDMGITRIDFEDRIDRFFDVKLVNTDILAVGASESDIESDYLVAKFSQDGRPVSSFGENGMLRGKFGSDGFHEAVSISIDEEQNAYVAINAYDEDEIHIIKLNEAGLLDTTFATSGRYTFADSLRDWTCNRVLVSPDQSIYIGSESGPLISVIKLDARGKVDSSFAEQGLLIKDMQNNFQRINAMLGGEEAKLWLCGETATEVGWRGFQMRLNANGSIDSTFARTGYIEDEITASSSRTSAICLQKDGYILFAGSLHNGNINDAYFKRYLPNGQPDMTFGTDGVLVLPTGSNNVMSSLFQLSDESILAAGDRAIVKLMPNGSLDYSFGLGGLVNTSPLSIYALSLDNEENMIAVGGEATGMFVAKYLSGQSTTSVVTSTVGLKVQVSPMPFIDHLLLDFTLPMNGKIRADIFDVGGAKVLTMMPDQWMQQGSYRQTNQVPHSIPAGIYFLEFTVGSSRKVLQLVKGPSIQNR